MTTSNAAHQRWADEANVEKIKNLEFEVERLVRLDKANQAAIANLTKACEEEREACAKIASDLEAMEARLSGFADNGQDKALLEERADASRVIAGKIRAMV
jgi:hypothetical protein